MHSLIPWLPIAALALSLSSCSKKEEPPAPPPAPAAQAPAPPPAPTPPPAGTASIDGEVELEGKPPEMQPLKRGVDPVCAKQQMNDEQVLVRDGKLQNVVVWISEGLPPSPPPSAPASLEQIQCMYRPRVQAIHEGQSLEIRNADPALHNIRAIRDGKTLFNKAQVPGAPPILQELGPGQVVQFKCDVHPWMKAFAVKVPHGFSAVSGADGKFSIRGLPDGAYTLTAWHELFGTKTGKVSVTSGKSAPLTFTYSAQDRGQP